METKLGISIGLLAAALYFLGLVGLYTPLFLLAGYVLLFESARWLKFSAVKAVTVCIFFSVISAMVYLIPNAITFIDNIFRIFNGNFSFAFATKIVNLVNSIITIAEKVVLLMLAFKSLDQKSVTIKPIDQLIAKHFPLENTETAAKQN